MNFMCKVFLSFLRKKTSRGEVDHNITESWSLYLSLDTDVPSFVISRTPGFGFPIREGTFLALKCEVDSNPASNPKWLKGKSKAYFFSFLNIIMGISLKFPKLTLPIHNAPGYDQFKIVLSLYLFMMSF